MTPVKYDCDLKNLTIIFARGKKIPNGEMNDRSFINPHPKFKISNYGLGKMSPVDISKTECGCYRYDGI